jgi:hypothetical protein
MCHTHLLQAKCEDMINSRKKKKDPKKHKCLCQSPITEWPARVCVFWFNCIHTRVYPKVPDSANNEINNNNNNNNKHTLRSNKKGYGGKTH